MNNSIISVQNVSWMRTNKTILNEVTWQVQANEHWAILGLNGSGKTSLLNMIMGYEWPSKGKISVLGRRFGQTNIPELRKSIGWVSNSFDDRFIQRGVDTALEVILSGKHASVGLFEEITSEDIEKAEQLLRQLSMDAFRDQLYTTLSQGEKRRVMIGRALMSSPKLLILDEPCNGLDIFMKEQLLDTINRISREPGGPTVLYVTHHIEEIVPAISHALLLRDGHVLAAGEKKQILNEKQIEQTFQVPVNLKWEAERPWLTVKKPVEE